MSIISNCFPVRNFFKPTLARGLSMESEWQQFSRTCLSILAFLNNAVVDIFVCHCLLPNRSWHKVNDPNVDYSGGWGKGRSGLSRDSNPAWLCCSSSPTWRWLSQSWEPFSFESALDYEHCAEPKPGQLWLFVLPLLFSSLWGLF